MTKEGYVLKYQDFLIFHYPLGFSIDQTDHILELINEWFPTGKFRTVDALFYKDSIYEKYSMSVLPLVENSLSNTETE